MSLITQQLQGACLEANTLLGEPCTLDRTDETLTAVFNARRKKYEDQEGGITEITEYTAVFPTQTTSTSIQERDTITKDNEKYFVMEVSRDELNTRLTLIKQTT